MRVDAQARLGAVTADADIAIGVAGLACGQVFSRLPCMLIVPVCRRKYRVYMTGCAGTQIVMLVILIQALPAAFVRIEGDANACLAEIFMTVAAEAGLVTAAAKLRVGAGGQGVAGQKITAVQIG